MLQGTEVLLHSTLDYAPAIVLAAMGGVLSERAGVVALGLEGMMRAGAFAAAVAALTLPTPAAVVVGACAGALLAAAHALLAVRLRADAVVSGLALNLVTLAAGTFLLESYFLPQGTPAIAQLAAWHIPLVDQVPLLRALSRHSVLTYLAVLIPFCVAWGFERTVFGLRLRSVGESPEAAASAGLPVLKLRTLAVVAGGFLAGLGGAALSTATLDRFEPHMPSGLGFVALAAVIFGRWTPLGAASAALLFAAASALRVGLANAAPALLSWVPSGALYALPYLLTLLLLALRPRGIRAPAALGRSF